MPGNSFCKPPTNPRHHLFAITLGLLRLDDDFANVPIKQKQFAVDGNRRAELCRVNACLEICEQTSVASGSGVDGLPSGPLIFDKPAAVIFRFDTQNFARHAARNNSQWGSETQVDDAESGGIKRFFANMISRQPARLSMLVASNTPRAKS
jgi:hypothetical protein